MAAKSERISDIGLEIAVQYRAHGWGTEDLCGNDYDIFDMGAEDIAFARRRLGRALTKAEASELESWIRTGIDGADRVG